MTRNVFLLSCLWALVPLSSFAGDSPVVQGLAGGGRVGVPRESLFSNPAGVVLVKDTFAFVHYGLPKIDDFNASGRTYSLGIYDGGNKNWKGGFAYSRVSMARIADSGVQTYVDRSEFKVNTGQFVYGKIIAGVSGRLVRNHNESKNRFLEGDAGVIVPVFSDLRLGATLENALDREAENPRTVGIGSSYPILPGVTLYGDGYRIMQGPKAGNRGWALAAEVVLAHDFVARGGRFQEAYRRAKGWSIGLSWGGPRASFDYVMRTTGKGPRERDHIFGMTTLF